MLSRLTFGSFLAYAPGGTSPAELAAIAVCQQIKRDGHLAGTLPILPYAAERLRAGLTPDLAPFLGPGVILVPMPRHAPAPPPRRAPALWVPCRLCQELVRAGLGRACETLLVRRTPVRKSAVAPRGRRPTVQEHYDSLAVRPLPAGHFLDDGAAITLVDDVITKGATLLAGAWRLAEAFPLATVRAFALMRTQNPAGDPRCRQVFRTLVDPVCATLEASRYGAWRRDP